MPKAINSAAIGDDCPQVELYRREDGKTAGLRYVDKVTSVSLDLDTSDQESVRAMVKRMLDRCKKAKLEPHFVRASKLRMAEGANVAKEIAAWLNGDDTWRVIVYGDKYPVCYISPNAKTSKRAEAIGD